MCPHLGQRPEAARQEGCGAGAAAGGCHSLGSLCTHHTTPSQLLARPHRNVSFIHSTLKVLNDSAHNHQGTQEHQKEHSLSKHHRGLGISCSNVLQRSTVSVLALSTSPFLRMALVGMALSTSFNSVIHSCDLLNDLNQSYLNRRDKKRNMQMHFWTTST